MQRNLLSLLECRGSMCGRLALKLAAGLLVTVSPFDERIRTGQGQRRSHEGTLPFAPTENAFVPQWDNAIVPAPTQAPDSLCRPLGNCCGKRQRAGKACAYLSVLIYTTDWRHIFSQAAAAASPAGALFQWGVGVAPACTPSCGMMALQYEFPVPRSKVDQLVAIDLNGPEAQSTVKVVQTVTFTAKRNL